METKLQSFNNKEKEVEDLKKIDSKEKENREEKSCDILDPTSVRDCGQGQGSTRQNGVRENKNVIDIVTNV